MQNNANSPVTSRVNLRVLLAEDNPPDACLVLKILEKSELNDFMVDQVSSLADALQKSAQNHYDVVLLDLFLTDSSGLETLEKFTNSGCNAPIIVLTGYEQESVGIEAIRKGAEEYLFKGELPDSSLARFISMAVERRASRAKDKFESFAKSHPMIDSNPLAYGPLRIDILSQTATLNSENAASTTTIALTPIEFRILVLMVKNCGEILTRSRIVSEIWRNGENSISARTVDKHLSALKHKLDSVLKLESIYGVGYRLNSPTEVSV